MFVPKIKAVLSVVLLLAVMAKGATLLAYGTAAGQEDKTPAAEKPVEPPAKQERELTGPVPKQDIEKKDLTAWGKEVGGLQAGLGYEPGEKRVHRPGETVKLVVRVRNVGKEGVSFQYLRHFFIENPPTVTDDKGKVTLKDGSPKGIYKPVDATLAPGKEIELHELSLTLSEKVADTPQDSTLYGEGKFQIQYERVLGDSMLSAVTIKTDPKLRKLATGKLDLVVSRWIRRAAAGQEKEAFTAWGKQAGGLQAGLGFRPGEQRAYHPGERVKLVVRVRNVDKDVANFTYYREFALQNLPTVLKDKDKVALNGVMPLKRRMVAVELQAGEEIDLCEFDLALQPPSESGQNSPWTLYQIGKFQIQFEDVDLLRQTGANTFGPLLDGKIATGKLELEVKEADGKKQTKKDPTTQPKNDQDTKAVFTRLKGRWTLFEVLQIQGNRELPHDESLSFHFADATFRQFQSNKATGDGAVEVDLTNDPPNLRLRFRKPGGGFSGAELTGPMDFRSDDELWIAISDTSIRTAEAMLAQPRVVWKLKRAPASTKEQTDSAKKVKELQKERIATLKKAAEVSLALAQSGRLEVWEAVEDRVALLKAELEVAETEADRVTLYKKKLEDLKVYEAVAKARFEAARGTELALHKVKAKRLETEIALEQAKMKQAKDGK